MCWNSVKKKSHLGWIKTDRQSKSESFTMITLLIKPYSGVLNNKPDRKKMIIKRSSKMKTDGATVP